MVDLINHLKNKARLLQKTVQAGDAEAIAFIREAHGVGLSGDTEIIEKIQRKHCLLVIARKLGFKHWNHCAQFFGEGCEDYGTMLYPKRCGAHWNIWVTDYEEAKKARAEHGGYLLCYNKQYLVVDEHFIISLGLDPNDVAFESISRDWHKGRGSSEQEDLYMKLINLTL